MDSEKRNDRKRKHSSSDVNVPAPPDKKQKGERSVNADETTPASAAWESTDVSQPPQKHIGTEAAVESPTPESDHVLESQKKSNGQRSDKVSGATPASTALVPARSKPGKKLIKLDETTSLWVYDTSTPPASDARSKPGKKLIKLDETTSLWVYDTNTPPASESTVAEPQQKKGKGSAKVTGKARTTAAGKTTSSHATASAAKPLSRKEPDADQVREALKRACEERQARRAQLDLHRSQEYHTWKEGKHESAGKLDRPLTDYLPDELLEQPDVVGWCRHYEASLPEIKVDSFNFKKSLKHNRQVKHDTKVFEPSTLIDHEVKLLDSNGKKFLVYIEEGHGLPWVSTEHAGLSSDIAEDILNTLDSVYPGPEPKNDVRHQDAANQRRYAEKMGWRSSVRHDGVWAAKGQEKNPHFKPVSLYNHVRTSESGKTPEQVQAVNESYRSSAPLEQTIGILLQSFFEEDYNKDLPHAQTILTGVAPELRYTNRKCKLTRAVLCCHLVGPHKDGGLHKGDMCIMFPVGTFEGGELWLNDLDIRIKYRPGSIIIFPAVLLQHAVDAVFGPRSSMVYFSKSSADTILQNWELMTLAERTKHFKDKRTLVADDARAFVRVMQGNRFPWSWPPLGTEIERSKAKHLKFGRYKLSHIIKQSLIKKIGYNRENVKLEEDRETGQRDG